MKEDNKQLLITDENNELVLAMKEIKALEVVVDNYNSKIKQLKDLIKQTPYTNLVFAKSETDKIMCSISRYSTERVSWDKEFLSKVLSPIDLEKAQKITKVDNVRITIK